MSEVPHPTAGDEVALGALLVLLNGAADSFRTVQATYRTWRHEQRLREAFRANIEEQKRRGASIGTSVSAVRAGAPGPAETKETVRIWREGQRIREERHGGWQDGYYGVANGPLWWYWSEQMGAMSNQDDPSVSGGIGQQLQVMLDPTPLLSSLRFRVAGNSQVAGRATVTAHATARLEDVHHGMLIRELHALGAGARPRLSSSHPRKANRSSPPEEFATFCSTSRPPKRSGVPHSPLSCQIACPPDGGCTACSLKPPSGHHFRRTSC